MGLVINGEETPETAIAAEAESLLQRFQRLSPEERQRYGFTDETMRRRAAEWARENVVERVLMRQEALRDPSPIPEDVFDKAVENMYNRFGGKEKFAESGMTEEDIRREAEAAIRVDRLIGKVASPVKAPKPKELAEYYRKHKDNYRVGESLRAAHIVKHVNEKVSKDEARQAIEAAKAELDGGADFEELADRVSDCPGNGGDLGWFARGKMVEEFEEVVFAMEPGEVSGIFESVFGFHIAKVYEKKPATVRPLSEVRDEIEREVKRERETKALEEFVDRLRESAKIVDTTPAEAVTAR
jgi:parvulin-like peptidyl-prolyl isomerase